MFGDARRVPNVPVVLAEIEWTDGAVIWRTRLGRDECRSGLNVLPKPYIILGTDVLLLGRLQLSRRSDECWLELPER